MRVLLVPFATRYNLPHTVPLLQLARAAQAERHGYEFAVLARADTHPMCVRAGITPLPLDHQGQLRTELAAYRMFRPDVVIDDLSASTAYAAALARIPRVAVVRTGSFPAYVPKRLDGAHSSGFDATQVPDPGFLGLRRPDSLQELSKAVGYIVPGTPSIERLPIGTREPERYTFAGTLLPSDEWLSRVVTGRGDSYTAACVAIDRLVDHAHGRKVVVVTVGTVAQAPPSLAKMIAALVQDGCSVISTVGRADHQLATSSRLMCQPFVPLDYVCQRADLVVHHCGSATYQYPLRRAVPAVTIGSEYYDRDDVGQVLEQLHLSIHVAASSCTTHVALLEAVRRQLEIDRSQYDERVDGINTQVRDHTRRFSVSDVIVAACQSGMQNMPNGAQTWQ